MKRLLIIALSAALFAGTASASQTLKQLATEMKVAYSVALELNEHMKKCDSEATYTQKVYTQSATYHIMPIEDGMCKYHVTFPGNVEMTCKFNEAQRHAVADEAIANSRNYLEQIEKTGWAKISADDSPILVELMSNKMVCTHT